MRENNLKGLAKGRYEEALAQRGALLRAGMLLKGRIVTCLIVSELNVFHPSQVKKLDVI